MAKRAEKRIVDLVIELKRLCRFEEEIGLECDLTSREVGCISALGRGDQLSAGELAGRLHLSPSRASRIITGVREKGCLLEVFDPQDRRAVSITLTPRGEEVLRRIEAEKDECEKRLLASFGAGEAGAVLRGLNTLYRAFRGGVNEPARGR